MKFSFHSLIPILSLFCQLPTKFSSELVSRLAGVSKLDSIRLRLLKSILLHKHFARTTQKTQPLYCLEAVFTAPLHSKRKLFDCRLRIRCRENVFAESLDVYSDFAVPAFGRHVTIFTGYRATTNKSEMPNISKTRPAVLALARRIYIYMLYV
jgi:hypothetical protein